MRSHLRKEIDEVKETPKKKKINLSSIRGCCLFAIKMLFISGQIKLMSILDESLQKLYSVIGE